MNKEELFWSASTEELSQGYMYDRENDLFRCLICHQIFENGVIYKSGEVYYEARKAITRHISEEHHSMFFYLLNLDKKYTGLSAQQKELIGYFKNGYTDKEIVAELGSGSPSTIRNHRFKLREKEKQAKVFLAMMKLLASEKDNQEFIHFHKGATMVDDRYAITTEEKEKILKNYFKQGLNGPLDIFPSKEKRKIVVLQHIMKRFDADKTYSEADVNNVLCLVYDDYVTLRRYLIEYGFMERSRDGMEYWVKA
ncbi:DUF2087 domain-containing protein [Lentibacillus sediminis]|uniref:DUF2087 domain-containing protein n=1 Tax=Lentibacillus sediminis TaxID=1940529 RepID=UPI000C1C5BD2|nr:DUF2087 domain-containing protein [Lentibacillus sediminis]